MASPETRAFWIAFNHVPGIGPARLSRLLNHFGDLAAAWEADADELTRAGLDRRTVERLETTRRTLVLERVVARLERLGAHVLTWEDEGYPRLLREIPASPPVLYVRGTLTDEDTWAIAVVGTRRMTRYGAEVTRLLVSELARASLTVVSGLALGVDRQAHQVTLEHGGRTVAVLGSGIDRIYPASNRGVARRIVEQGALITDYPPGTPPDASNFPPRNRIISGLSLGTLVIEAGERSGALITARFAADQGRDVFAVPGSILSPHSRGTNRLIRDGAVPVLEANDILEALNVMPAAPRQAMQALIPDTEEESRILAVLSREPMHVDEIGQAANVDASTAAATLALMELKGLVRSTGGMTYVRAW
ncbi:MAG: DNA-processing protein DprA [Ardenticatenia bacterium]|nr:DNA-processing protein DprA [Ardenticatenia bacterium]